MSELSCMLIPLTGTFPGWPTAEQPSVALWLFVVLGIPVLVAVVIAVVVGAGALARRGRGERQLNQPVWYGQSAVASGNGQGELTDGGGQPKGDDNSNDKNLGGTSVRW
ncbi:hypothetical protein CGZ93_12050 [Enemella dayhoffiae]|uniref:Uncharacterized protein n=2 Tax=Enemella dayhoffiae TaxID=2016507 RepID=A0A255GZB0_9ACTN|nr:hypothetical protein CGZ93_12050 [Enemella dayhoffiae]